MTEYCSHCGAKITPASHKLTPGLVSALHKFHLGAKALERNSVHLRVDMTGELVPYRLTMDEINNFSKLKYIGLVDQIPGKSGYWGILQKGVDFLNGTCTAPAWAKTRMNRVIDIDPKGVFIQEVAGEWWEKQKRTSELEPLRGQVDDSVPVANQQTP